MRTVDHIVLATLNRGKFEEFEALARKHAPFRLVPVQEFVRNADTLNSVEKFGSYLENATAKARIVNHGCHYPSLADDTGIEVEALDGRPGVKSHRYAPPQKGKSQDHLNIELLLSELKGKSNRKARFICTLVLVIEGICLDATGVLEGTICEAPRGEHGFGYDSIFVPNQSQKTLAEMTSEEKNAISHRTLAFQELVKKAKEYGIVFAKP